MNGLTTHHLFKIGEVADRSSLPVKTIRYYDEIDLLTPTVERSESGYRLFKLQVFDRLSFIKRAQSLGMSLQEVKEILTVHDRGQLPCGEVKHHLQEKVEAISQQIEALQSQREELQGLLTHWQDRPPADSLAQTICPNIKVTDVLEAVGM